MTERKGHFTSLPDELKLRIFHFTRINQNILGVNKKFLRLGTTTLVERIKVQFSSVACADALQSLRLVGQYSDNSNLVLQLCGHLCRHEAYWDVVCTLTAMDDPPEGTTAHTGLVLHWIRTHVSAYLEANDTLSAYRALRVLDYMPHNVKSSPTNRDVKSQIADKIIRSITDNISSKHIAQVSLSLEILCQLHLDPTTYEDAYSELLDPLYNLIMEHINGKTPHVVATMLARLGSLPTGLVVTHDKLLCIGKAVQSQIITEFQKAEHNIALLQDFMHLLQYLPLAQGFFVDILKAGQDQIAKYYDPDRGLQDTHRSRNILEVLQKLPPNCDIPEDYLATFSMSVCDRLSTMIKRPRVGHIDLLHDTLSCISRFAYLPHVGIQLIVRAILFVTPQLIEDGEWGEVIRRLRLLKHLQLDAETRQSLFNQFMKPCQDQVAIEVQKIPPDSDTVRELLEISKDLSAHIEPTPDIVSGLSTVMVLPGTPSIHWLLDCLPDGVKLQTDWTSVVCDTLATAKKDIRATIEANRLHHTKTLVKRLTRLPTESKHWNFDLVTLCLNKVTGYIQANDLHEAFRWIILLNSLPTITEGDKKRVCYVLSTLEACIEDNGMLSGAFQALQWEREDVLDILMLRHKIGHKTTYRGLTIL